MGTIARHAASPFVDGETLLGADLEGDFATIYDEFNGNIDDANLADSAVTTPKIAASAVTQAKMTSGAATMSEVVTTNDTGVALTGSFQTIGSSIAHTVGNPARHVVIMCSFATTGPAAADDFTFQLLKDGVSILGVGIVDVNRVPTGQDRIHTRVYVDASPTPGGSHTYAFQAKDTQGATLKNAAIVVFEPRS